EKIYKNIKEPKLLKELFLNHLIQLSSDESIAKRSARVEDIPNKLYPIVEQFVSKRLFIKDDNSIEIAHEALISSWDKLHEWISEEEGFLIFKSQLEIFYKTWTENDKNKRALLSGLNLDNALEYRDKIKDKELLEFINESEDKAKKEKAEKERQKKLIQEEKEKRLKSRRNFMIAGIGSILGFVWWRKIETDRANIVLQNEVEKANHNIGLALLEKAKSFIIQKDFLKANFFAYSALTKFSEKFDETNAFAEARSIISNYPYTKIAMNIKTKNPITSLAFSPDGSKIISSSWNGTIKVWTLKDFSKEVISDEIASLEQQLQAKLEGVQLKKTKIPYTKPIWSRYNPSYWLLELKEAKTDTERAKIMLELGLIYDRNNENQKALEWYKKSAQKGYKEAEEQVLFLENWMKKNS
ncbi:MAG: hypothetical protein GXO60_04705, partial [Epsilonproteobacteria bacterium]|nr:hypothetical protein [Campylobacterota bacterium]